MYYKWLSSVWYTIKLRDVLLRLVYSNANESVIEFFTDSLSFSLAKSTVQNI